MDIFNQDKPQKAMLVALQLSKMPDEELEGSLAELGRLVTTLGYLVIGQTWQRRGSTRTATVLGDGKLKELARWTGGPGVIGPTFVKKKHRAALKFEKSAADERDEVDEELEDSEGQGEGKGKGLAPTEKADLVVFDTELSPSQLRNLESALGVPVLDRTGVIIEIFSRHARTRAARLQVEIARLTYVAPRLRETGGNEDRGGGGVGAKGAGETSLELDKRNIRDRIKELKQELESIADQHQTRRARREQEISVALVGYTNAGKSSLMRALTSSEVLVADKLFATLDTTVRMLQPETRPKILISDTVGFIKKLPHDLVASFKSTLDEALNASLLLYVVDAADSTFRSQLEVTRSVLQEVGVAEIPSLLILNKIDRLDAQKQNELRAEFPDAILMSAKNFQDVAQLRQTLVEFFESDMTDEDLLIPYNTQGAIGEIRSKVKVLSESYNELGLLLRVRATKEYLKKIKAQFGL